MSSEDSVVELEEVADLFADEIRSGQSPSIDAYLVKYPQPDVTAQEDLRKLLRSIEMIEGAKRERGDSRPASRAVSTIRSDAIDDYTLVREIGRGGMGVVYEAVHQSLGRRVAIKVLSDSLLGDPKHLARFRIEARAAAKLRHPHIVPVFGVGHSDPHHYYVMDFIRGKSLRELLKQWNGSERRESTTRTVQSDRVPCFDISANIRDADSGDITAGQTVSSGTLTASEPLRKFPQSKSPIDSSEHSRWVARQGTAICSAIGYAHSQGVLHRDIKPANLLLDEDDQIWIADFGLAKLSEQQDVTKSGDMIGTPQYMPPEFIRGAYDERSEIYAIGLTLYELLTLQPAIQGASVAETVHLAGQGVTTAPSKQNPALPEDLDTILVKALNLEPKSRYANAEELGEDLQRFLDGRPILARRTSRLERLTRWAKREPVIASLTAMSFTLLVALAAAMGWGFLSTRSALNEAKTERVNAERSEQQAQQALSTAEALLVEKESEFQRAELNLQSALNTFEQLTDSISQRGAILDVDFVIADGDTTDASVNARDAEILEILVRYLDELAENNGENLRTQSALAARQAGDIYVSLGKLRKAEDAYGRAKQRFETAMKVDPENQTEWTADYLQLLNRLIEVYAVKGNMQQGLAAFREIENVYEDQSSKLQTSEIQFQFAHACRLASDLAPRAVREGNKFAMFRRMMLQTRELSELAVIEQGTKLLEQLYRDDPDDLRIGLEYARSLRSQSTVLERWNREGASASQQHALTLLETLRAANPDNPTLQYEYAITLLSTDADATDFQSNMQKAEDAFVGLQDYVEGVPKYRAVRALGLEKRAEGFAESGRTQLAREYYLRSVRAYSDLVRSNPELRQYRLRKAEVLETLTRLLIDEGELKLAIRQLEFGLERPFSRSHGNLSAAERAVQSRLRKLLMEARRDLDAKEEAPREP